MLEISSGTYGRAQATQSTLALAYLAKETSPLGVLSVHCDRLKRPLYGPRSSFAPCHSRFGRLLPATRRFWPLWVLGNITLLHAVWRFL